MKKKPPQQPWAYDKTAVLLRLDNCRKYLEAAQHEIECAIVDKYGENNEGQQPDDCLMEAVRDTLTNEVYLNCLRANTAETGHDPEAVLHYTLKHEKKKKRRRK